MAEEDDGNTCNIQDLFKEVTKVTSLAHYARVQAHEADLKARNAMALAERAVCEAGSVRQVAESLTHTARAVAKVALEIATSSGIPDHFFPGQPLLDIPTDVMLDTKESDTVGTTYRKYMDLSEEEDVEICDPKGQKPKLHTKPKTSSSYGVIVANTAIQQPSLGTTASAPMKFTEAFPANVSNSKETLPKEIDSSHSLPTVWEDSYQGPREFKRVSYTEKKSLRKIQRKLRNIEDEDVDESDVENNKLRTDEPCQIDDPRSLAPNASKEKLLQSVRFSETTAFEWNKK